MRLRYFFYILLFFILGCDTRTVHFSFVEPNVPEPIVLHDTCDYLENFTCLEETIEQYVIEDYTFTPVDIVFILDVSGSIEDNFKKIGVGFQSLISSIQHLDWRIYFTTADHGDHRYFCSPENIQRRLNSKGQWQSYCPREHKVFSEQVRWQDYQGSEPKFGQFMPLQFNRQILSDQHFLDSSVPSFEKVFRHTLKRDSEDSCLFPPFCQGSHEQPVRVMKTILERHQQSGSFRENAHLVFFVVTEEPERREDRKNATRAEDVLLQFSETFEENYPNKEMIVYGISIQNQDCLNAQDTWDAGYSSELNTLVQKTKGISIDICEDDYTPAFTRISNRLRRAVNNIHLEFSPHISKKTPINVKVIDTNGEIVRTEWIKNDEENTISFSTTLPEGASVNIRYYHEKKTTS